MNRDVTKAGDAEPAFLRARRAGGGPLLSIVVPCYNEAGNILELYRRVTEAACSVVADSYELVLVNDGSRDSTWPTIVGLAQTDRRLVGINLARNHGHQLALSAGLFHARGERTLILDADLQDPPELLPAMMSLMDAGADVVYGQRTMREGETRLKRWSAALFYRLLASLSDTRIPIDAGDFRLINRRALNVLNAMPEQHRFIRGMVSWLGFNQVPIPYERHARFAGQTGYPVRKMIRFAVDAMTGFSIRPLQVTTYLGIGFAIFGIGLLGYTLISFFFGEVVRGWTSVLAAVVILGSLQLLMLGVFGEYLGRLYIESKRRPLFIIEQIVGTDTVHEPVFDRTPSRFAGE